MLRHVTVEDDDRDLPGTVFLAQENLDKFALNRSLHVRDGKSAHLVGHVALNTVLHHAVGILLSLDAESDYQGQAEAKFAGARLQPLELSCKASASCMMGAT